MSPAPSGERALTPKGRIGSGAAGDQSEHPTRSHVYILTAGHKYITTATFMIAWMRDAFGYFETDNQKRDLQRDQGRRNQGEVFEVLQDG